MKKFINKVQTTFKAIQLLSEPDVMNKLYGELHTKTKKSRDIEASTGKFIFHKHFIVQVMS